MAHRTIILLWEAYKLKVLKSKVLILKHYTRNSGTL